MESQNKQNKMSAHAISGIARIADLERIVDLESQNQKLVNEVTQLRTLLSKTANKTSGTEEMAVLVDRRVDAAEMLVDCDEKELDAILRLVESGGQPIAEIVAGIGALKAVRVGGWLGRCQAALINRDRIDPTYFGHHLVKWVVTATAQQR
jgi:hypothetical protein